GVVLCIRAATPDGVDVLLDNVGGEQLTAALRAGRRAPGCPLPALSRQLSPRRDRPPEPAARGPGPAPPDGQAGESHPLSMT
ncbi:hypothetical protein ACFRKC_46540, partial [Streptomyces chartreusis]